MAIHILSNALILLDGYNLTTRISEGAIEYGAEALDVTDLSQTNRVRVGGLKTASMSASGFYDPDTYDEAIHSRIGVDNSLVTMAYNAAIGSRAFAMIAMLGEYKPFGNSVGEVAGFNFSAGAQGNLIRGYLMEPVTTAGSTANGTGRQLGAVGSGSRLYAGLHIFAASGTDPTLDMIVQRDDNSGFTSALTAITFTQMTAAGAQWQSVAGAIADDYYRFRWTIGGTTPSFQFAAFLGIGV